MKRYDEGRVSALAESIRQQGLLQPATVRVVAGSYQLVSGHARRAAFRYLRDKVAATPEERATYSVIRCVRLGDIDDARAAALTAIENLQRDDGTPLEQALMVARARDAENYRSISETAEALGLPLGRVRQYLQLADGPAVLQRAVSPGVMVTRDGGARERMALPLTRVLAVRPYYDFPVPEQAGGAQGPRSVAATPRRATRPCGQQLRGATARERTPRGGGRRVRRRENRALAVRGRAHVWSVSELQTKVRKAARPEWPPMNESPPAESEESSEAPEPVPAPPTPGLYSERRGRLTVWPSVISQAEATERGVLAGKLRTLRQALEG